MLLLLRLLGREGRTERERGMGEGSSEMLEEGRCEGQGAGEADSDMGGLGQEVLWEKGSE